MLRQDEDADVGPTDTNLLRRLQPFVGEARRHADVDDRHIRLTALDEREQLLGVRRQPCHLEARLDEEARESLAQEGGVVGDDYPHGIST